MCERFKQELLPNPTLSFITPKVTENHTPKRIVNIRGNANIIHGSKGELIEMTFGFNKKTNTDERFMYNARAEGIFNKDNVANYTGELGIHQNGWAMEGFYSHRALVPVTSFVEGSAKKRLKRPYDVSLKEVQQFYLAAIVDTDVITGKLGFCIITCWPNELMVNEVGYQRMPVIIEEKDLKEWLNTDADIEALLPMLKPYPSELMEVVPLFAENTPAV